MKVKKIRNTWFSLVILIGLMTIGVLFLQQDAFAKSKPKVKTITITKINQKTAKQVHKQLMRGKKFKLRVKGNTKNFHKKAEKLMDKVALCTEYRFDFYPIILSGASTSIAEGYTYTKKGYTYYTILPRDCKEYIYGIKFAKRRHKLFVDYIDKTIPVLENARSLVTDNNQKAQVQLTNRIYPKGTVSEETIPKENIPTEIDRLIASTRELSKYLHKTKFYKLSEAMKARIMLPVSSNIWCKPAMRYTLDSSYITFEALYKNKAYGECAHFASATCKICAVFNVGSCDYFHKVSEDHAVARTKVKTLSGKMRYSVISNGGLADYNDYVGYKSTTRESYRRPHKMDKKIKKINVDTQELKMPYVQIKIRTIPAEPGTKKMISMYCIDIPRSEW